MGSKNRRFRSVSLVVAVAVAASLVSIGPSARAAPAIELVEDLNPSGDAFAPSHSAPFAHDDRLFFAADNGTQGEELVVHDVSADTTTVIDINPGGGGSDPREFVSLGGLVLFAADSDGNSNFELWKSDGTAGGTFVVGTPFIAQGPNGVFGLENIGDVVYFAGNGTGTTAGAKGTELWKTDGTDAGTDVVHDIRPGVDSSFPSSFTPLGTPGEFVFRANDGTTGLEPWTSDGTSAGTQPVEDINPTGDSNPGALTSFGGEVFFQATNGATANGVELWRADGTDAQMIEIATGTANSSPTLLTPVGTSQLFFAAWDDTMDRELYVSNGTTASLVENIHPTGSASPTSLFPFNGVLIFAADRPAGGRELWRSDGTPAGTDIVADINPTGSSNPGGFVEHGGQIYFKATDGTNGRELFTSDGAIGGNTAMVQDLVPGPGESAPGTSLIETPIGADVAGILYFDATTPDVGRELRRLVTAELTVSNVKRKEGDRRTRTFSIKVVLSAPSSAPVTVDYATANGKAKSPKDYTAETGTLTFAPGDTTESIGIKVRSDRRRERKESFTVTISNPSGAVLGPQTVAKVVIVNDD